MTTFGGQTVPPLFIGLSGFDPDNPATWPAPVNNNPNVVLQNFFVEAQNFTANPNASRCLFRINTGSDASDKGFLLETFSTTVDFGSVSFPLYQWSFPDNFFLNIQWRVPPGGVLYGPDPTITLSEGSISDAWTLYTTNRFFGWINDDLGMIVATLEFDLPPFDDIADASCTFRLRKTL